MSTFLGRVLNLDVLPNVKWLKAVILMSCVHFYTFSYKGIRPRCFSHFARSREYVHVFRLSGQFGYISRCKMKRAVRFHLICEFILSQISHMLSSASIPLSSEFGYVPAINICRGKFG